MTTTTPNPNTVGRTLPIENARAAINTAEQQRRLVHSNLAALGQLFGQQVRAALLQPFELYEDLVRDGVAYYEEARTLVGARMEERAMVHREALNATEQLLARAVNDAVARSKKSGRPLADWATEAGRLLEDRRIG